jgi:hypothetical protein
MSKILLTDLLKSSKTWNDEEVLVLDIILENFLFSEKKYNEPKISKYIMAQRYHIYNFPKNIVLLYCW